MYAIFRLWFLESTVGEKNMRFHHVFSFIVICDIKQKPPFSRGPQRYERRIFMRSTHTCPVLFVADALWHRRKTNAEHVFLSSTDNVPFDGTLRVKATHTFLTWLYYTPPRKKTQAFEEKKRIIFSWARKLNAWGLFLSARLSFLSQRLSLCV